MIVPLEQNLPKRTETFREKIPALESAIRNLEPVETELFHHFGHLTYTRELRIPAGSFALGKIHRHECTNILMQGKMQMITAEGDYYVEAPSVFKTGPGIQKAVYILEDVILLNIHPWDGKATLEQIEAQVIVPSYEQFQIEAGL